MTRINCIDPVLLSDKHLLAEYRELPRVFGAVRKAQERGERPEDMPESYRLGKGHVKFFYSRLRWLVSRQKQLVGECINRGFKIQHTKPESLLEGISNIWVNDWTTTAEATKLNIERINARGGLRNE